MVYSICRVDLSRFPGPGRYKEAQEITEQIWAEFIEISTLSQQIVTGDDKDDEAIIARADAIRAEAIHAIEGFLNL